MTELTLARGNVVLRGTAQGTGPTVLLLHAGGEDRRVWAPVTAQLVSCGLRTVAYDLRGHGESSGTPTTLPALAKDVAEMIGREPAPVGVVGASLGGLAAIAALADRATQGHVAALVLIDVVPDPEPARVHTWLDERGLRQRRPQLVDDVLARGPQLLATAGTIHLPILLVRGGTRSPLDDADVSRLRHANHRVSVTCVPGAGHLVARDAPLELARIIADRVPTWFPADPTVRSAYALQLSLGADRVQHPGGTLLAHLGRVHTLTVEWSATTRTQLAAISHATYGTDGFPHALLPTTERRQLGDAIGSDAEALVYLYGACDRGRTYHRLGDEPVLVGDRFTGYTTALQGDDLVDFAVLTIANELDVARFATLSQPTRREIRGLIRALATYAPAAASWALGDPSVAG